MISVVIPVYNHRIFLQQCIESALLSSHVAEVIAVDDGSVDGCERLLSRLAATSERVKWLPNSENLNRGAPARLNELVARSRSKWIAVLNSDDAFVSGRFEALQRDLQVESECLILGDLVVVDQHGTRLSYRNAIDANEYAWPPTFNPHQSARIGRWVRLLAAQNIAATTTNMLFTRSLFDKVGGFRPFRYVHDWDFALRAAIVSRVLYRPLMLSRYRLHSVNTIGEGRGGVEAEVRRMMDDIAAEFTAPEVESDLVDGMRHNRYVTRRDLHWLTVIRKASGAFVAAEVKRQVRVPGVRFAGGFETGDSPAAYVYAPDRGIALLSDNDLRTVRLCLSLRSYDLVLLSRTMKVFPMVAAASPRDLIIYNRQRGFTAGKPRTARSLRLMPGAGPAREAVELTAFPDLRVDHAFGDQTGTAWDWPAPPMRFGSGLERGDRPVVFVFPIFLAVGGAERLVLETMRHLSGRYQFVVVTTEPLAEQNGSLHAEALRYAHVYDLPECAKPVDMVRAIELLRDAYGPAVVWITNGSPWQIAHAHDLRQVFSAVPIVDNQVYDHERGWINAFVDDDVRSADRFIAINRRIRTAFIERFGIPEASIDVVYHGGNISDLINHDVADAARRLAVRKLFGLAGEGLLFGMVGRLTPQKRPWDLVHLASRCAGRGLDIQFIWVGPGELRAELLLLCEQLNCTNFRMFDAVSDVRPVYEMLDGLIVTSEFEGLPFVVIEALAFGVPVLSTPVGAIAEVLADVGTGLVSGDPGDLDTLEERFLLFVSELSSLRATALDRRQTFIERFSSERMAAEYEQSWATAISRFKAVGNTARRQRSEGADAVQAPPV